MSMILPFFSCLDLKL